MPETVYFNLNFDDFHPQYFPDFGGQPDAGVFQLFRELLDDFPGLKITLFTVPNWIDRPRTWPRPWYWAKRALGLPIIQPLRGEPFRIDKHMGWCQAVRTMVTEGKFEIAVHGCDHCNPLRYAHSQEFADRDETEAFERVARAEELFDLCGIPFVKGFRPPGWGLSAGLIRALRRLRYRFISPFSPYLRLNRIGVFEGLAVPPQNWGIVDDPEVAVGLAEACGVVFAKGHIAARYGAETMDGITPKTWDNLRRTLHELHRRFDVRFVTMDQFLSDRFALLAFGGLVTAVGAGLAPVNQEEAMR